MRCRRRFILYFPEDWDKNEIAEIVLELGNYFGLGCIKERAYKPRSKRQRVLRLYMNGSQIASGRSIRELRARFWSAWRKAKKMGIRL